MASLWVAVVAWNDGSESNIDVVGVFNSHSAAFEAVQAHLIDETGFVVGMDDPSKRNGTMRDSNVTWNWAVEPVERVQP